MTLLAQKPAPPDTPPSPGAAPSWRGRVVATSLALVALMFLQDPGRIAADTKLDLTVNPWGFLARSLHLWDPEGFFGQLQNQAYGYLWPMGPFFGLGQMLGLPDWVVQRLWWSLIVVTAFVGMYVLLRVLRVGHGWPQLLAALGYALAVRPQSAIGAVSVEVWPMAVAPWVLIPLVIGARRGNVVRWAALSALAVATAGGVNAVAAGAVLPVAVWWLLTCGKGPRRRRLAAWWAGLTTLAILWWLIPLVVLGRYSPPFLDWIESAQFTTSITDPTTVLRGADHWVAYLGDASVWKAGWMLGTYPVLILATGVIAALGIAGLAMRSLPHRAFLIGAALVGLVLVTAGHTWVFSGLGSQQIQQFLDGAGAPLRNVHKFDLVLRIPLIIAFCHVLSTVWPTGPRPRWRVFVTGIAISALVLTWLPTLTGQLTRARSYTAMADHWRDTAQWLNTQAEPGRALIVPGASFAQFVWGRTQDEPLQAIGGYPWGVRDAVPLSSAGNIRMLDAVEARLQSGQASPGLAQYLERMGVRYLVVRNDLAAGARAPEPIRVHRALDDSPGIDRVAFFGPIVDTPGTGPSLEDEGIRVSYPAVEIYEVTPSNAAPDARVLLRPQNSALDVAGGPESLLWLADAGMLGNRVAVLAGDPDAQGVNAAAGVLTDTDRRRELTIGYMRDQESATMTADQLYRQGRPVHDYRVFGEEGVTVAEPTLWFDASSSPTDVDATFRTPRGATPGAAMDGALDTYWRPGQVPELFSYWEVQYPSPITLGESLQIALQNPGKRGPGSLELAITTDAGRVVVDAEDTDTWQTIAVPAGQTRFVRITSTKPEQTLPFGIREVALPGEGVSQLRLPAASVGDAIVLTARPGDAAECLPRDDLQICSDGFGRFSQDRPGFHRVVDLPSASTTTPRIWAAPRDTASISDALNAVAGVQVQASSTRTSAVAGSGRAAFDREIGTAWQAAPNDPQPSLTLTLPEKRTLRGIRLTNRAGLNASSPLEIKVEVGDTSFTGFSDARGLFTFDPVTTDRVTVTFLSTNAVRSRSALGETILPVGVSELGLIGADDLRQPLPPEAQVTMPCGTGPDIVVDGRVVSRTSLTARVDQLRRGDTLPVSPCSAPVTVPAGEHRLVVRSSEAFAPQLAVFAPESAYSPTSRPQSPRVDRWDATDRAVEVSSSDSPQVLEIAENFNPGWQASLGGQQLEPLRADGWKQAFVVPAGAEGTVTITFAPNSTYRAGLLVGLLGVLLVLLLALRPPRMAELPSVTAGWPARTTAGLVATAALLTLGVPGLIAFLVAFWVIRKWPLPAVAGVGVMIAVGVTAVAGPKPDWPYAAVQALALATAMAAVARAAWTTRVAARVPSASVPATDVR